MNTIKICFTGGGTAGHVIPNISVMQELEKQKPVRLYDLYYIGSQDLEKKLIESKGYRFYKIQSGKLRRYFSWQNFSDVFKIMIGFLQALFLLMRNRPHLVFSKGGFVAVPVCYAAFVLRIPVFTHESDLSPGLATKLIKKIANRVLYTFEESKKYFGTTKKAVWVGPPTRAQLFSGKKQKGLEFLDVSPDSDKKILLVMGGSLGSQNLNNLISQSVDELCKAFYVIHITGNNFVPKVSSLNYRSFTFIHDELSDVLACTDLVISRAGANAIYEFLCLEIPMLLIPLEQGSRGDQLQNAEVFRKNGWAEVLLERNASKEVLLSSVHALNNNTMNFKDKMKLFNKKNAVAEIIKMIEAQIS